MLQRRLGTRGQDDWLRPSALANVLVVSAVAVAALAALVLFGAGGWDYYRTPLRVRAYASAHAALRPSGTLGHALGIAGLLMMTVPVIYSVRKKWRRLARLGEMRHWLERPHFLRHRGAGAGHLSRGTQVQRPHLGRGLVHGRGGTVRLRRALPLRSHAADDPRDRADVRRDPRESGGPAPGNGRHRAVARPAGAARRALAAPGSGRHPRSRRRTRLAGPPPPRARRAPRACGRRREPGRRARRHSTGAGARLPPAATGLPAADAAALRTLARVPPAAGLPHVRDRPPHVSLVVYMGYASLPW